MGLLDVLASIRDIFEVGRKTTSEVKKNKPQERKYNFYDGEKMPKTTAEYKRNKNTNKNKVKNEDDLEL